MKEKVFFGGLDMLRSKVNSPTKMPRTAIIPVIQDRATGYLNAGPYSGGIASVNPLHIAFGPKSATTIESFRLADEFCVALPNRSQIDEMWVTGLGVPKGINEIELAGWNTLESGEIKTPGIAECPINLECRKIFYEKLPEPWRAIVVGEVVGVSIDCELLRKRRSEVVQELPMHESNVNPDTFYYGPTVLTGELLSSTPGPRASSPDIDCAGKRKLFVSKGDLYKPAYEKVLINAIPPMPAYFLLTTDENGKTNVLPIVGGKLQSSIPTLEMPVPKDSYSYKNIKRTGQFVLAIITRDLIKNFQAMEKNLPDGFSAAGLTLLRENMVKVKGIAECPVNIDYKSVLLKDVDGANYAMLVGRKVGVSYDKDLFMRLDRDWPSKGSVETLCELYSTYVFAVMDEGFTRKWGFHTSRPLSVKGMPTWGTRYGTSWTGPRYFNYWLIELQQEGLIAPGHLDKIATALMLWYDGHGQPHLREYYDEAMKKELQSRLTKLFKMMAWAHRDYGKWREVQEFIDTFPPVEREPFGGPAVHELWNGEKVVGMHLLQANLK